MQQRNLNNDQTVTNVVPEPDDNLATGLADIGQKLIANSQEAKITENVSKAQLDLSALSNQYQIDNQGDPFKNLDSLKEDQQGILDKYGDDISPIFRRQWNMQAQTLTSHNDAANQAWGFEQTRKNSVLSINNSMLNNYTLANNAGADFGNSTSTDVMTALNYEQSRQNLQDLGNRTIGETATNEQLLKYKEDYAKSFLSGVAESNPNKAAQLLDDDNIKSMFTSEQRDELVDVINKTRKKQQLQTSLSQSVNASEVTKLVNDNNKSFFDKRLQIDQMELNRKIDTTTAVNARRVLTSQKDVDNVTDGPVMSDIVTRIYDINTNSDLAPGEYLSAVKGTHDDILDKQANGKLTTIDAQKLNDQLRTLTSKKVADATQSVGNDFSEANDLFAKQLPLQYRGQATRQLFYDTTGQTVTPQQYKVKAQKIIDSINSSTRNNALKTIQQTSQIPKLNIPQGAIDKLRIHPDLSGEFDIKYGTGASKRILGQ